MRLAMMLLLALTQLASALPARGQGVRLRIELLEVHSVQDTETVLESDRFYVVAALLGNVAGGVRSDVVGPVALRAGEARPFPADRRVVFDAVLPTRGSVRGGMRAFNQNSDAEWPNRDELAEEATAAVAGVGATFEGEVDEWAGAILGSVAPIYGGLPGSKSDTPLGRIELNISADGDAAEVGEWTMFENTPGANTFEYKVRYRITRGREPEALGL